VYIDKPSNLKSYFSDGSLYSMADFGPPYPSTFTGKATIADADSLDGCTWIKNSDQEASILIVKRGNCTFS